MIATPGSPATHSAMSDRHPQRRYALYFAPPRGSALDRFGSAWLGRDAWTDSAVTRAPATGFDGARLAALTAAPRRYGFHATLKAPFALAKGVSADTLAEDLAAFAGSRAPVAAGSLQLSELRGFIALILAEGSQHVRSLADACVERFQPLARALTEAEIRRRRDGLTPRQRAQLEAWNYPYVFDDYQFHMTLTGPTRPSEIAALTEALRPPLAALLDEPLVIDAVTLFVESRPGADFTIVDRFPLTGPAVASY